MKLSTKGRYGLRVMLDIATHQGKGPAILRDISRRQDISEKYLWQVINPLKAAGMVNSSRGAKGGYMLAKSPEDITVLDIVSILEGPVCLVDCADTPEMCQRSGACVAREVWVKVEQGIKETIGRITLKELIERQKEKESGGDLTYVI